MRPLFFEEPDNSKTYTIADEYLWGDNILVAPVVKQGAAEREVYFPKGSNWTDMNTKKKYVGGSTHTITLTNKNIPHFARGGSFITEAAENIQSTDLVLLCLPANEEIGAGDEYIAKQIKSNQAVFLVVTKADAVSKSDLAVKLTQVYEFATRANLQKAEIIPVSAKNLDQTELLLELLSKHLPQSPALYPTDINTDQAEELMFADLIREAAIQELYEELPHSVMVTIEEMGEREGGKIFDISATLHVERDSQKGIIIGPQGSKLKAIGTLARKSIENLVGMQVFLQIHVKVSKEWQKDTKLLAKLGFTDALSD